MKKNPNLTTSALNYIKAIYNITLDKPAARVKDISKYMEIGASSVSEALKMLSEKGYINYEPYGIINLTDKGISVAEESDKRHKIIKNFFEGVLVVNSDLSEKSAEMVEHNIPDEVLKKFVMFLEFMQTCSCKEPKWMKSFKHYSSNDGILSDKCQRCISLKEKCPDLNNSNCCGMSK